MTDTPTLGLVIPVYNEAANLPSLIESLAAMHGASQLPHRAVIVENGSTDGSLKLLESLSEAYSEWLHPYALEENAGYGGGVHAGIRYLRSQCSHVGWIPGDGQVPLSDVAAIWEYVLKRPLAVHKGLRTHREDGWQSKMVSKFYSTLSRWILDIPVKDTNGLPKVFPSSFLEHLPTKLETSFLFDAHLLHLAYSQGLLIEEHPVRFEARKEGESSWSSRRVQTYLESFQGLRRLKKRPS